jgi:hypothetical protein
MELKVEIKEIDFLYKSYGFEINTEDPNIRVYLYKKSRYYGAEIIPIKDDRATRSRADSIKKQYSTLGYATTLRTISNIEETDIELFKSFFSYNSTRTRLKRKYEQFISKQTRNLLGNHYEYIESPFEVFNEIEHSNKIFELITDVLNKDASNLIIIEASAGYGKTCTAYELLKLLTEREYPQIPIFTELARNRGAKIFRYILLDEIDIEFPSLNSELVIAEIKKGRIPLIIDGFDELLDKVVINEVEPTKSFEEVETMLDTIGNLLESKAKIILTTRRTAIFNGVEFDRWYSKWSNKFSVTRLSLQEPRIKDWLGEERFNVIKENNVPIQYIANPVLLTYLKNITEEEFNIEINTPEILIKHYFDKMLERERERQNLIISIDKQYEIFKNVVKLLLDFDITTESKEFFKEIIKDQNYKLLEYTRTLYTGSDKPSVDNLVDTLATHALLDRKGRDENQIGFINDFVLGTFIGEIISESTIEKIENDYSNYMIELSVTAYRVQSRHNKSILWEKLMGINHRFQQLITFYFDIVLKEAPMRNYNELYVYDVNFYHISFDQYTIKSTVFLNCLFKRCVIDIQLFEGVSFIDCMFESCIVLNGEVFDEDSGITAIKCKQENCSILPGAYYFDEKNNESEISTIERSILDNIMKISQTRGHHIMQLVHCFEKAESRKVIKALDGLEAKGFVDIKGNHIYPSINKIQFIKQILGII